MSGDERSDEHEASRFRGVRISPPIRLEEGSAHASKMASEVSSHPGRLGPGLLLATVGLALLAAGIVSLLTLARPSSEPASSPPRVDLVPESLPVEAPPAPEIPPPKPPTLVGGAPEPAEAPPPAEEATSTRVQASPRSAPPTQDAFVEAMSAGFRALRGEDPEAAKLAFTQAVALRPQAAEAKEGLAQAEEIVRLEALLQIQQKARELEADEEWRKAAESWAEALAFLPSLELARLGRERCLERAELAELLEFHLRNPARLADDAVFEEASALVARAETVDPEGPKLLAQKSRLEQLLRHAATPVRAILESDEKTEVVVYRVGELGTFRRRVLELRPGRYTVVGRRLGYRDVRLSLEVAAGGAAPILTVRCEEPI